MFDETMIKYTNFTLIFIDWKLVNYFSNILNYRIKKETFNMKFILSLNIVTNNDLYYGSCNLKLDLLKKNVHLNLYYRNQIDKFIENCLKKVD